MNKYLVIIVVYNRDIDEVEPVKYFNQLNRQDYTLFIYDNSPIAHHIPSLYTNIVYRHNSQNPGIATAYNEGVRYARDNNYQWILLFDQDTEIKDTDFVLKIDTAIAQYPNINLFVPIVRYRDGIMSPRHCKFFRPTGKILKPGKHRLEKVAIINSGIVVSVNSFVNCGGYNENTFLDLSDYQFIERLQSIERDFIILNSYLFQDFSNDETSPEKLYARFKMYCKCLKGYKTSRFRYCILIYTGLLHTLFLFKRTKQTRFLKNFIKTVCS